MRMTTAARVLSVQSHVVHGYVGNKCAVFPLQLLGYEVDFVNSVQFAAHTGYPHRAGTVLGGSELDALVDGLEKNELLNYSHLLTGYIGSAAFLRSILRLVAKLRDKKQDCFYLCDPVLGDNGMLYVPQDLIQIYRQEVLPLASVVTPNQFEIETLTGIRIKDEADAIQACRFLHDIGVPTVIITTLEYDQNELSMMLSLRDSQFSPYILRIPKLDTRFTGSGDLTSALLLAWMNFHKNEPALALEKTASSVFAVLKATADSSKHYTSTMVVPPELCLISSKHIIENPPIHTTNFIAALAQPPDIKRVVVHHSLLPHTEEAWRDQLLFLSHDMYPSLSTNIPLVAIKQDLESKTNASGLPTFSHVDDLLLNDILPNERLLLILPTTEPHVVRATDERILKVAYAEHPATIFDSSAFDFTISNLRHLRRFFRPSSTSV
uniref:pyridoxal kinase n=1 Tax=Aureoumbra lagunensis TaxID=44058 RepID=A0A7S3NMQ5_9STRA|mmetsp:Transcript_7717/g.11674  ORF Transcript_7717/g.11674 Transcript_7717/m.11674 type:complete len:437 (+) Transcript_7717:30-1340(+)